MRELNNRRCQCCKMLLLCWSVLSLCLCVSAENVAVCREPGQNVTLECSLCSSSAGGYIGMYLYSYFKSQEEVLYYHSMEGAEKISERKKYKNRIQKEGSLRNHSITISNLDVHDSGVYTCVYKKTPQDETKCNIYVLVVRAASPEEPPPSPSSSGVFPPLALAAAASFLVSVLLALAVIMLLVPRVKCWTSCRRARTVPLDADHYVYEVMTKNVLQPAAPDPYDAA